MTWERDVGATDRALLSATPAWGLGLGPGDWGLGPGAWGPEPGDGPGALSLGPGAWGLEP